MKRLFPALALMGVCVAIMAPSCKGTSIDATSHGLSGVVTADENQVTGQYRYDGKAGPANVIGDLQRKPPGGKWTDEGRPTSDTSDGGHAGGTTNARIGRGKWRLKVTLTNRDTGAEIGHWYTHPPYRVSWLDVPKGG